MDSQNLPCPRCPKISHSQEELVDHLRRYHKLSESEINSLRGRGYFEAKTATVNGDVAIEHQKAAVRAQAGNAINIPFVPPPDRKRTASTPAGWAKTIEGFSYEKLISQTHTIDTIEKKVLRGKVASNYAALELFTYRKDVGTLSELQDKERILEAKLSGYITSDPEYPEITKKLYETKEKIRELKGVLGADTEKEVLLEDWYSGDLGEDASYIEWQEKFMGKALIEAEQVMKSTPTQEIKL